MEMRGSHSILKGVLVWAVLLSSCAPDHAGDRRGGTRRRARSRVYRQEAPLNKLDDSSRAALYRRLWDPVVFSVSSDWEEPETLRRADDEYRGGDTNAGLQAYRRAANSARGVPPMPLVLRLIAAQLSSADSAGALNTIARMTAESGLEADRVPPELALLVGYSFGQAGNYDQAVAWFDRVNRQENPSISRKASEAIGLILATLPQEQFEEITSRWDSIDAVPVLVAQERSRRERGGRVHENNPFGGEKGYVRSEKNKVSTLDAIETPVAVPTPVPDKAVAFIPLSGDSASLGRRIKEGVECGLKGESEEAPRLVAEAIDAADPGSTSKLEQLIRNDDHVVGVIGPFLSSQVDAVLGAVGSKVPVFVLAKRAVDGRKDVYGMGFGTEVQLRSLARGGIIRSGVKRLAITAADDPQGKELAETIRRMLVGSDVQIVFNGLYGNTDFSGVEEIARKLEAIPIDGLFIGDGPNGAARLLSTMGPVARTRLTVFGPASWQNMTALKNSLDAFEGAVFPAPFLTGQGTVMEQQFEQCVKRSGGGDVDFLGALGFDVATLIKRGPVPPGGEFSGLTGTYEFRDDGVMHTLRVGQVKDGAIVPFSPIIRSLSDVVSNLPEGAKERRSDETGPVVEDSKREGAE